MDDKITELVTRVERLEARVSNLAELVESLAGTATDYGGRVMYDAYYGDEEVGPAW